MTDIVERLRIRQPLLGTLCDEAADEIERLTLENWQLKGALGYPVPGDIPQGPFKCGLCEARALGAKAMTDIVKRLRERNIGYDRQAADEIERQQAEIEHLRTTIGYLADNISDYPALVAVAEATLKPRP